MAIVPTVLFAIAAVAAAMTIWKSISAALPAIHTLRAQLAEASRDHMIHVATLETRLLEQEEDHHPVTRSRRHPRPKPVTHRLHQFPHRAHAA